MSNILHDEKLETEVFFDNVREKANKAIIEALDSHDIGAAYELINSLHIADLADLLDKLSKDERERLFDLIRDSIDPLLLAEIRNVSIKEDIIKYLGTKKIAELICLLEMDDTVSVLVDLDESLKSSIIFHLDAVKKKELEELLAYPENSVGRIMHKNFVVAPEHWSVGETIDHIRKRGDLPHDFYKIFVIDTKYKPIAFVTLGALMHHPNHKLIKEVMETNLKVISTDLDQEEMSFFFKQYGYVSLPVVSKAGRLVGAVTIDDAVEVIEKEAEEDIMHMGGIHESDIHLNVLDIVTSRFPWLFINLLTASIVALVIKFFEGTIQNIIVLATLMPVVASLGGNAGTQTMTVSVVGLVSKDLTTLNYFRVILRQIFACALNGILMAVIGGIMIYLWNHDLSLSLIFALSIIVNFSLAGLFGSSIPILIHRIGLDPAIASPIFLTTLTDIFGFLTFLGLATLFLL
jgi:magnesium transporter